LVTLAASIYKEITAELVRWTNILQPSQAPAIYGY